MFISIFFVFSVIFLIFTFARKFKKRYIKVLLIVFEFLLVFFLFSKIIFPKIDRPPTRGNSNVKTDLIYYEHRTDYPDMATEKDLRQIPVHVYFPEKLEEKSHPLLIFSHGSFGIASSNESLFYELASQGFIVMSLDHPYHSFFTSLSSGKTIFVDKKFFKDVITSPGGKDLQKTFNDLNFWLEIRIEDINFLLDKILDQENDNIFESKIDKTSIYLSGHSLGGSAALAIGRERYENIKALIIFEAPFVKDIEKISDKSYVFRKDEYKIPIVHFYSDSLWERIDKIATYGQNRKMIEKEDKRFVNIHIEGVGHIGLTDMYLLSPILTNTIDGGLDKKSPEKALQEINDHVLDFLSSINN